MTKEHEDLHPYTDTGTLLDDLRQCHCGTAGDAYMHALKLFPQLVRAPGSEHVCLTWGVQVIGALMDIAAYMGAVDFDLAVAVNTMAGGARNLPKEQHDILREMVNSAVAKAGGHQQ